MEQHVTDGNNVCDLCGKVLSHPSSVIYHKEVDNPISLNHSQYYNLNLFQRLLTVKERTPALLVTSLSSINSYCNDTRWFIQTSVLLCVTCAGLRLKREPIYIIIATSTAKRNLISALIAMPSFRIKPL